LPDDEGGFFSSFFGAGWDWGVDSSVMSFVKSFRREKLAFLQSFWDFGFLSYVWSEKAVLKGSNASIRLKITDGECGWIGWLCPVGRVRERMQVGAKTKLL
jgi:hypothetical protein